MVRRRRKKTLEVPPLRWVRQFVEYAPIDKVLELPRGLRGIYVLYQVEPPRRRRAKPSYNVVYVGMARQGGIRWRLRSHRETKRAKWTHFSAFEVWPNISDAEVAELEGLLRHIFRRDATASGLNKQRGYSALLRQPRIELRPLRSRRRDP